ncbi:MAG: hypothetical protein WCK29_01535 [archaeon]
MATDYGLTAKILEQNNPKNLFELIKGDYKPFSNFKIKVDNKNFEEINHKGTVKAIRDRLKGLHLTLRRTSNERIPYLEINPSRAGQIILNPYNAEVIQTHQESKNASITYENDSLMHGRSLRVYEEGNSSLEIKLDDQFPYMLKSMDPDKTGLGARK